MCIYTVLLKLVIERGVDFAWRILKLMKPDCILIGGGSCPTCKTDETSAINVCDRDKLVYYITYCY